MKKKENQIMKKRKIAVLIAMLWIVIFIIGLGVSSSSVKAEERAIQEGVHETYQKVNHKKNTLELKIHYYSFEKKYKKVKATLLLEKEKVGTYKRKKKDKFGAVFHIGFTNKKKVKTAELQITLADGSSDCVQHRVIDLTQSKKGTLDIYVVQGNKEVYYKKKDAIKTPVISEAYFVSEKEIKFSLADTVDTSDKKLVEQFQVKDENGKSYPLLHVYSKASETKNSATLIMQDALDLGKRYTVYMKNHISSPISVSQAFSTEAFDKVYYYDGDDLGAIYTKEKTNFRLWAPTASQVTINFYSGGTGKNRIDSQEMLRSKKGTWVYDAIGDYKNVYYTYSVTVDGITREAVDPYARATGQNGERGMVIDLASAQPSGFQKEKRPNSIAMTDSVIYEAQLQDFTLDDSSGIINKGKYLALTEKGTKNVDGMATGLDHLVDMGITHLEIVPTFKAVSESKTKEKKTQYALEMDSQNYNVPEGVYATDTTDGNVRVKEYKQMVQSLHENGIRVSMNVTYDHTFDLAHSNFQKIVPDYYYRKNGSSYANGTGYGNETATERAMMRKYIVDSIVYWAKEYHIDGFHLEQMGIYDIQTMQMIRQALDEIDANILLYGDGWTNGKSTYDENLRATKTNMKELDGIATFCNDFCDGLRGTASKKKGTGFLAGNNSYEEDIKLGIVGGIEHPQIKNSKLTKSQKTWANSPEQCINYVSRQDMLSLWASLQKTVPKASKKEKIAMSKLAAGMMFTSQGTPFVQAGEEFSGLQSKKNTKQNSADYSLSEQVNVIKWDKISGQEDIYKYYKGLLAFRKAHKGLSMKDAENVQKNLHFQDTSGKGNVIAYTIANSKKEKKIEELMVIHNGNAEDVEIALPDENTWAVYVDGDKAGTEVIREVTNSVHVDGISTMVLVKENQKTKTWITIQKADICQYLSFGIVIVLLMIGIFFLHNNCQDGGKIKFKKNVNEK